MKIKFLSLLMLLLCIAAICPAVEIDLSSDNADYIILDSQYYPGRIGPIAAGDVNGDGFDDYILGAPRAAVNYDGNTGIGYVRFGFSMTPPAAGADERIYDLSSSPTLTFNMQRSLVNFPDKQGRTFGGVQFNGEYGGHLFADSTASGDFNGDGADEIVYSMSERLGPSGCGKIYVERGHSSIGGTINYTTEKFYGRLFTINGRNFGDEFGSVLAFGDINGDGKEDLVIGSPKAGGDERGTVDIIYGATMPFFQAQEAKHLLCPHTTITGAAAGDRFGSAITFGDVNNDGVDDLIVGAPQYDSSLASDGSGAVFVFYGAITPTYDPPLAESIDLSITKPDKLFFNAETGEGAGASLASCDFDGDGRDDIFIGAPYADFSPLRDNGKVYVIYNDSIPAASAAQIQSAASLTVFGSDNDMNIGFRLLTGNFNNDSIEDIVFSAPQLSTGTRQLCGRVFALFGADFATRYHGVLVLGDTSDQKGDIDIIGAETADKLGYHLACGDFNNDGIDDIFISCDKATFSSYNYERAWMIRGSASYKRVNHKFANYFNLSANQKIWNNLE